MHVLMLGVKGLKVVIGLTSNDEIFFLLPLVPLIFKSVSEKKRMQCRFFLQLIYTALSRERKGQNNTV